MADENPLLLQNEVEAVSLLVPVPVWRRGDVLPFAALYAAWVAHLAVVPMAVDLSVMSLGALLVLHAFVHLCTIWSVKFAAACTFTKASWTASREHHHVLAIAKPHCGRHALCPVNHGDNPASFVFRQRKYSLRCETATGVLSWQTVDYPVDLPVEAYCAHQGLEGDSVDLAQQKYGPNTLDIPLPTFKELLLEHLLAPIFVFQVFSMLLYCLDDYWYFSLLTLVMLVFLESIVVRRRVQNVTELREMRPEPFQINVYRNSRWRKESTADIVPGDIISLGRSHENTAVPCDVLLIGGSCIVNESTLTGEAVPQMKVPLVDVQQQQLPLSALPGIKQHIIFAGTQIVQARGPAKEDPGLRCSDNGGVCYVLRTGFATDQGNLVRAIMSFAERASASSAEIWVFLFFLLVFALAAAGYVFQQGLEAKRKLSKLVVECLLIVATVVPPDLPIQMTLAVNQSLSAISKLHISCTEPFRIPLAGKVDVCCFDKTGTLTSDTAVFAGLCGLGDDPESIIAADDLTQQQPEIAQALASCQALAYHDKTIIGDPLEVAILEGLDWTVTKNDSVHPNKDKGTRLSARILQRFHFSSDLKRMTTISETAAGEYIAVTKGAAEVVLPLLKNKADNLDRLCKTLTSQGLRVLALGMKSVSSMIQRPSDVKGITREQAESNLDFAGFVVTSCPVKKDSRKALKLLRHSSHHVVMITGDAALTACHVAKDLHITKLPCVLLRRNKSGGLEWVDVEGGMVEPFNPKKQALQALAEKYDLCITGETLDLPKEQCRTLFPFVKVFARVAPGDKAHIVSIFNSLGLGTLMCGDGTNDVGALKRAHVGVALTTAFDALFDALARKRKQEAVDASNGSSKTISKQQLRRRVKGGGDAASKVDKGAEDGPIQEDPMSALDDFQIPKLGDASIAAPFTSKKSSVMSIVHVVRQGRCTLVTTMQMLQILALNSLVNAFSMSVMHLEGVKLSDTQMTFVGLFIAICMLSLSWSQPLEKLSKERPPSRLLSLRLVLSVIAQFGVHLAALVYVLTETRKYWTPEPFDPDAEDAKEFKVTLLNTAVYLLLLAMQASTFIVNCRGPPFMQGIFDNKPLLYTISALTALGFFIASGVSEGLSSSLELADIPGDLRVQILGVMAFDLVATFMLDRIICFVFPLPKGSSLLRR